MMKSILPFKYGKPSEIAAARIHFITSLRVISNYNPKRFQQFYEKSTANLQALKTTKN